VLLRAKTEGVHVDTGIRSTGVVLERLDGIEVGALTLGEAVLAVKLKLSSHDRVLTPAVHVKGSLGKHEGTGLGDVQATRKINSSESGYGVRKRVKGISVVKRLSSVGGIQGITGDQRAAVVNVGIRLDDPDQLLAGVVEVELDLVGGRTNRLVTSELDLLDEVLVGVLCHLSALIGIKEDIINVERSSNKGLLVSLGSLGTVGLDCEQALTDRTEINVDLDLVVLKSNQRKGKSRVAAKPELKRNVKSSLRKGLARSTHLVGCAGCGTRTRNVSVSRVSQVSQLGGVTDHLVVTSLLLLGKGKLIPDVHPITILTVYALSTNLNLNLGDKLLTDIVQPTGLVCHGLVNLRNSHLKVCTVSKVTVTADGAGHTASEIGLTREGLLDGLHGEVGVASVGHLPESNLRGSGKEYVLCAVGD
jgi:hypothetical protein